MVINYIGPGRRHTGDWCLKDGFIKFQDLITLYNQHFTGKTMELICDCSYSGKWIKQCTDYLDEQKILPCGHYARAKNTLLAILTASRGDQIPHNLLYAAEGLGNDKNKGICYNRGNGYEIKEGQNMCVFNNTALTCKEESFDTPCLLPNDYNWQKKRLAERLFLAQDSRRIGWGYILVIDDDDILSKATFNGINDISLYGEAIKSGEGQEPPIEVRRWIDNKYPGNLIRYQGT